MDFGGFLLWGMVALAFLCYLFLVVLGIFKGNPQRRDHVIALFAMGAFLLFFGGYLYRVYFLDEPLAIAAAEGNITLVRSLLAHGGSPNAEGVDGNSTALVDASAGGYLQIVQLLIDRGADVNRANSRGQTALQAAREAKHNSVIQLLIKAGAKK